MLTICFWQCCVSLYSFISWWVGSYEGPVNLLSRSMTSSTAAGVAGTLNHVNLTSSKSPILGERKEYALVRKMRVYSYPTGKKNTQNEVLTLLVRVGDGLALSDSNLCAIL